MVGINIDLFGAIEKFIRFRQINEWTKLVLSLVCSYWLSCSFAMGSALVAHRPMPEALGAGLIAGSTMAIVVWRRSPHTRGLILALPAETSKAEDETNQRVIRD
ncbi:MAG: hypothetical protein AB7O65_14275 [Candidatus Korobacteraceae bacterium]